MSWVTSEAEELAEKLKDALSKVYESMNVVGWLMMPVKTSEEGDGVAIFKTPDEVLEDAIEAKEKLRSAVYLLGTADTLILELSRIQNRQRDIWKPMSGFVTVLRAFAAELVYQLDRKGDLDKSLLNAASLGVYSLISLLDSNLWR